MNGRRMRSGSGRREYAGDRLPPWFLVEQYVRPYQRAMGQLMPDGSLNLFTGEIALMVGWVVIWSGLGIFSIWYIRRSYSPPAAVSPQ